MSELPVGIPENPPTTSPALEANLLGVLEWIAGQLADLEERSRVLAKNYEHLDEQTRLASQVQRDLLPSPEFRIRGARVHTLYRPVDRVSGDIYDIARLDETHVGISLADATGHGMPAALLSVFIKRSLVGKEIFNGSYRIVPPDEVLTRLNRDILEADLSQCRFVTALHAVYDEQHRCMTFARGGLPYPIHVPKDAAPRQVHGHGGLVGAFETASYETVELPLCPGDRVLFHTDGLDSLVLGRPQPDRPNDVRQTAWLRGLTDLSSQEIIDTLDRRLDEIAVDDWHPDDITVVLVEIEQ